MLIGCCSSILPQVWPKSRSNTQGPRFSLVHSGYNTTSTEFRSCLMEPDVPCARAGFETTVRGNRIRELTNRQPKDERLNPPRQKEARRAQVGFTETSPDNGEGPLHCLLGNFRLLSVAVFPLFWAGSHCWPFRG